MTNLHLYFYKVFEKKKNELRIDLFFDGFVFMLHEQIEKSNFALVWLKIS